MKVNINSKYYGRKLVLYDIHFNVHPGTMVLVIGSSGVGKTTLIKCLLNDIDYKGKVQYDEGEGKGGIGYIRQHPGFNESENVYQALVYAGLYKNPYAKMPNIRRQAKSLISSLGISGVAKEKIKHLSGGQRQRVAIGREMMRKTKILLMDEPFSALDSATARTLVKDLSDVIQEQKRTAIVVSHNLNDLNYFDRLLVLTKDSKYDSAGRVAYFGEAAASSEYFGTTDLTDAMIKLNDRSEREKYIQTMMDMGPEGWSFLKANERTRPA